MRYEIIMSTFAAAFHTQYLVGLDHSKSFLGGGKCELVFVYWCNSATFYYLLGKGFNGYPQYIQIDDDWIDMFLSNTEIEKLCSKQLLRPAICFFH